jgi:hypothetical protein
VGTVFLAQFTSGVAGAAGALGLTVVLVGLGGGVLVGVAVLDSVGGAVLGSVAGALSVDVVPGPPVSCGGAKLRSSCLLPC